MKFDPPIQFPVRIRGEQQTAFVKEQIGSADHFIIHASFSDGFEDFFYLLDNGGIYGTTENSELYEQSLKKDVGILIGLDPNLIFHIFEDIVDGTLTNIWIIERKLFINKISFAIYYNNEYHFDLLRSKQGWVSFTTSILYPDVDKYLAIQVSSVLDNLLS